MTRDELRHALLAAAGRGELRPSSIAETYRVPAARCEREAERLAEEGMLQRVGSYHVFGATGIAIWSRYRAAV
jgi:hypothetical protein